MATTKKNTNKETPEQKLHEFWRIELELAEEEYKAWHDECDEINRRYKGEVGSDRQKKYGAPAQQNILWANVQTLAPSVYAKRPKIVVKRRFSNKAPVVLVASEILERATDYFLDDGRFDQTMRKDVIDYLLPGRGVGRIKYAPETVNMPTGESISFDEYDELEEAEQVQYEPNAETGEYDKYEEVIAYEDVEFCHVKRQDFKHSARARDWDEVRWVAFASYPTREEIYDRFLDDDESNLDQLKNIPLNYKDEKRQKKSQGASYANQEVQSKKAEIWEIWDKETRQVIFWAKGAHEIVAQEPDPYGLKGFFPCPRPLDTRNANDSLVPIPDFRQYKHQADELDEITRRKKLLLEMVRVSGVYDKTCSSLKRIVNLGAENVLIPEPNFQRIAEMGGLKGVMDFLPFEEAVAGWNTLSQGEVQQKQTIYELSGVSDVIRGASDPRETATAQRIKGRFGSNKLKDKQDEVARYARDAVEIMAEVVSSIIEPQTVAQIVDIEDIEGGPQLFQQAMQLLRDDATRCFRIEIETDSTIAQDEMEEKQAAMEFITGVMQALPPMLQLGAQAKELGPFLGELLMFGVKKHRAGRGLEQSLRQTLDDLMEKANQPQQQPPNPMMIEMQLKQQEMQMKGQAEMAKMQTNQQKAMQEMQLKQQKFQQEVVLEKQKQDAATQQMLAEMQLKQQEMFAEIQLDKKKIEEEIQLKYFEMLAQYQLKEKEALMKATEAKANGESKQTPWRFTDIPGTTDRVAIPMGGEGE